MSVQPNSVLKGAFFTVFGRWISRLIGLVNTVVLARLLLPEDFGIVAMAFIVLGLAATFLDIGVNVALIRNQSATDVDYHCAWTLRLIQTLLVAGTLVAIAPAAGDYFRDHRVTPVIMLLALNVLIASLENIGVVKFQKNQQFDREFRYQLINRLFLFVSTIALAIWLRSYWALVIAATIASVFTVIHSYWIHPLRPQISFKKLRELFSVSHWMLIQNLGLYVDNNLHKVLVGRRDDTAALGTYALASDLAALPSTELLQPLNRVLFPAFVKVKGDLTELKRVFLLAQSIQVMVALPAACFLALLAENVIPILLGSKWVTAVPYLQILAIGSAIGAIQISAWYVSVTLGRERLSAYLTWIQVGTFALLVIVIRQHAGAIEIAFARVAVPTLGLVFQLWIVKRALGNLRFAEMLAGAWRPLAAVCLTSLLVSTLPPFDTHWASILLKGPLCLILYVAFLIAAWKLSGMPDGAERYTWNLVRHRLRRSNKRNIGRN